MLAYKDSDSQGKERDERKRRQKGNPLGTKNVNLALVTS